MIASSVEPGVKFDLDVLKDLDSRLVGVSYEKKTVKEDGQDIVKWYAKCVEGEGATSTTKEIPVTELYKSRFPKYMTLLMSETVDNIQGTPYPEQVHNEPSFTVPKKVTASSGNAADEYLDANYGYLNVKKA